MDIIDRILILIKKNGWSVREFERRLGKSTGTFNAWKSCKASPEKHLARIAKILYTTESYLRGETDDPSPTDKKPAIFNGQPASKEIAELWEEIEDLDDEEAIKTLEHVRLLKLRRKL